MAIDADATALGPTSVFGFAGDELHHDGDTFAALRVKLLDDSHGAGEVIGCFPSLASVLILPKA